MDFMIADDLSQGWYEESSDQRKRGRQKKYSDFAIEQVLKIRYLFGLRLRQVQGFIEYIFETSGLNIDCPDYSLVSKRSKALGLSIALIESEEEFDYFHLPKILIYLADTTRRCKILYFIFKLAGNTF